MSIDMTYRHDVTKVSDFNNGGLWGKSFVGSSWNFVSGCIKKIDTHDERFSSKKQEITSYRQKASDKLIWNEQ